MCHKRARLVHTLRDVVGTTTQKCGAADFGEMKVPRVSWAGVVAGVVGVAALLPAGCGGGQGPDRLTTAELKDPATCQTCHPAQFEQWSHSMHAYASDDPVFIAMNQRGQRETNGALGDFCVKCHAPAALRDGLTTDGQNLASLPAAARGVTCFFCHSAASIDGDHNDPLVLATDGRMLGPFDDPPPPHICRDTRRCSTGRRRSRRRRAAAATTSSTSIR